MKLSRTIRNPIHRPIRTALTILVIAAVPAAAVAVPTLAGATGTAAVAASCPTGWGSLPEESKLRGAGVLTNVRTGKHACFDRIVFDVKGKPSWFLVRYVKSVATVGEGKPVPLRGGAKLEIILSVPAYDENHQSTYNPANRNELTNLRGYRTFRQAAELGSFEGETSIALGVRARLPFRVFTLTGPGATSRIVVDVAHGWHSTSGLATAPQEVQKAENGPAAVLFRPRVRCHESGAIVVVKLRNPTKTVRYFEVRLSGGVVSEALPLMLPARGADSVEFHGIPNGSYVVEVLNDVGNFVADTRARVRC